MAWSDFDTPSGAGQLQLYIAFKGGSAMMGPMSLGGTDNPTDEQYQAVVDALNASSLVQSATLTNTVEVAKTMTYTEA